jgi:hypothetical protein
MGPLLFESLAEPEHHQGSYLISSGVSASAAWGAMSRSSSLTKPSPTPFHG